MRPDPCMACGSRTRVEMEVDVVVADVRDTAIVSACWGCGYALGVVAVLDEDGNPTTNDYSDDAMDDATTLIMDIGDRVVWLRRCRDRACLRWSATSNLRWLQLARKLESARRRAVEPLRLIRDIDRVDIGPSHVELLAITRAELRWRGEGLARKAIVARAGGVSLHVQSRSSLSIHVDEAIREAATQDGVFRIFRPGTTDVPTDHGTDGGKRSGGDGEGSVVAPGEAESDEGAA